MSVGAARAETGFERVIETVGYVSVLAGRAVRTLFRSRFEGKEFVYQMEQLGVRSLSIASATAVFVGIVMTIQFGFFAQKFGAVDALGRFIFAGVTVKL